MPFPASRARFGGADKKGPTFPAGVTRLGEHFTLSAHAWSRDRSLLACAFGGPEIEIYNSKFELQKTLDAHLAPVTGLAWAHDTNRLLSVSEDRNGYVWTLKGAGARTDWAPQLVVLRLNRAATCCVWSPDGTMFAVGSSEALFCLCTYNSRQDWWKCDHHRLDGGKVQGTCLGIAWSPDGSQIATVWSGGQVRYSPLANLQVKGRGRAGSGGPGAKVHMVRARTAQLWCHDCAYSPEGTYLAVFSHDNTVLFIHTQDPGSKWTNRVRIPSLPVTCGVWLSDTQLVVGGFDGVLAIISSGTGDDGPAKFIFSGWVEALPKLVKPSAADIAASKRPGAVPSWRNRPLTTKHQGRITSMQPITSPQGGITGVSSTCSAGFLVHWTLAQLKPKVGRT